MAKKEPTNYKRLKAHRSDCGAVRSVNDGSWDTAWTIDSRDALEFRDSLGRNNKNGAYKPWIKFRCNDTQCHAQLLVKQEFILSHLPKQ